MMLSSLRHNERFAWMSATILLLLLALFSVQKSQRDLQAERKHSAQLIQDKSALKLSLEVMQSGLTSDDNRELKRLGLKNPTNDLIADLIRNPQLIKFNGVLGGKMGFYESQAVRILNRQWILADFDDGHITGQALLKYTVSPTGKISWRVLDAQLD